MSSTTDDAVLSDFESALLGEIRAIETGKETAGTEPTYALAVEVRAKLNAALNRLYSLKLIEVGSTLNDKWIKTAG